ncbi:ImmA/IrrE family metallo-endopeptidase [Erythrobacter sp.]|uniref:ImmA/IrrE family metallo-endopeptidase n=1 Tax=Erythrobacter sp. TaxID=1042 RepID=UPI0025F0D476|nr:ImmA/IrrE family metallo-endopeptidase [Erythrobacter sp.]
MADFGVLFPDVSCMKLATDGLLVIVLDLARSKHRQASTLMHELAHSILDQASTEHEPSH